MLKINFLPWFLCAVGWDERPMRFDGEARSQRIRSSRIAAERSATHTLVFKFRANKIPSHLSRTLLAREQKAHRPFVQKRRRTCFGLYFAGRLSHHFLTSSTGRPLLYCVLFSAVQSGRYLFGLVLVLHNSGELVPQCSPFFSSCCLPILH